MNIQVPMAFGLSEEDAKKFVELWDKMTFSVGDINYVYRQLNIEAMPYEGGISVTEALAIVKYSETLKEEEDRSE